MARATIWATTAIRASKTMIEILQQIPVIYLGLFGSLMAGLSTGLGALPIFFLGKISPRVQGILLGFGAGVMLAATSFP